MVGRPERGERLAAINSRASEGRQWRGGGSERGATVCGLGEAAGDPQVRRLGRLARKRPVNGRTAGDART